MEQSTPASTSSNYVRYLEKARSAQRERSKKRKKERKGSTKEEREQKRNDKRDELLGMVEECTGGEDFKKVFWPVEDVTDASQEANQDMRNRLQIEVSSNFTANDDDDTVDDDHIDTVAMLPAPVETLDDARLPKSFIKYFETLKGRFEKPTPVQSQTWPAILSGFDVLAISPTGSGKSLSFLLPAVTHILARRTSHNTGPVTLVMTPTRELALQLKRVCAPFRSLFNITAQAIVGGQDRAEQVNQSDEVNIKSSDTKEGSCEIVLATPGRLVDLVTNKLISLSSVSQLALDEADRMLAMGFETELLVIMKCIRPDRQTILTSATFASKLQGAISKHSWMGKKRIFIRVATLQIGGKAKQDSDNNKRQTASEKRLENLKVGEGSITVAKGVEQQVQVCAEHKKPRKLIRQITAIQKEDTELNKRHKSLTIVFCSRVSTVLFVAEFLAKHNVEKCGVLHGQLPQKERERVLFNFSAGKIHTLIATDVAARGIHVSTVRYVINYDFPGSLDQYMHRIGRAGRDGKGGKSFSFFTRNLAPMAPDLINILRQSGNPIDSYLVQLASEHKVEMEIQERSRQLKLQEAEKKKAEEISRANEKPAAEADDSSVSGATKVKGKLKRKRGKRGGKKHRKDGNNTTPSNQVARNKSPGMHKSNKSPGLKVANKSPGLKVANKAPGLKVTNKSPGLKSDKSTKKARLN